MYKYFIYKFKIVTIILYIKNDFVTIIMLNDSSL